MYRRRTQFLFSVVFIPLQVESHLLINNLNYGGIFYKGGFRKVVPTTRNNFRYQSLSSTTTSSLSSSSSSLFTTSSSTLSIFSSSFFSSRRRSKSNNNNNSYYSKKMTSTSLQGSSNTNNNDNSNNEKQKLEPPVPRREEDRVVYAGIAPDGWDTNIPRQAEDSKEELIDPPIAIPDPYGWLRDESRTNKEILEYLQKENEYTDSITSHVKPLRTVLYNELLSYIQETDCTVPIPKTKDYVYYIRTYEGLSYRKYCRAPITNTYKEDSLLWDGTKEQSFLPNEQIILDLNIISKDQSYCSEEEVEISPSQSIVAYTIDFSGYQIFQLFLKDLITNEIIHHDKELQFSGEVVWGRNDNDDDDTVLYFMTLDDAHRPNKLYRRIFTFDKNDSNKSISSYKDELLFEETNELYWPSIYKSKDNKYLFLDVSTKETSEVWYLNLNDKTSKLQCIAKRREKVLYTIEHRHNKWWITTNINNTPNLQLMTSPAIPNCEKEWELVQVKKVNDDNDDDDNNNNNTRVLFDGQMSNTGYSLEDVTVFDTHVICEGRDEGIPRIWILSLDDDTNDDDTTTTVISKQERIEFNEPAHDARVSSNYDFYTNSIIISYDSLITPPQTIEIQLSNTKQRTILKTKIIPGYNKELFTCKRYTVLSRDGITQIPVSVVYRKDVMDEYNKAISNGIKPKPLPTMLHGYGSYGSSTEAEFYTNRLPLLNRGMIYVIAHVRGGSEMGRYWYEEPNGAKYLCKKNTFNDFIDVAKWLVYDKKWTTSNYLACYGRSAGGLLVMASINQEPELFKVCYAGVPFVDVVCTMIDGSLPLTTTEWCEWGNPNEFKYLNYMLSYSPINNVKKNVQYPSCLLTGGLHDPYVSYWEPAKMIATLRHEQDKSKQSGRPCCIKLELSAGHGSASDKYKHIKELAYDYTFVLDQLGLANIDPKNEMK